MKLGDYELDRIYCADALDFLRTLPDESVNCCVTSPPYFGLRSYMENEPREIGKEQTPAEYVAALVEVFREVRRVLRADGTCWLNLGDSFANDTKWGGSTGGKHANGLHGNSGIGRGKKDTGLKPKDLIGIPWRVAFALQDDGWFIRQDCIWWKRNAMPSSQRDRPTTDYEHVFMLTRSAQYWYDDMAVREPSSGVGGGGWSKKTATAQVNHGGEHYDRPVDTGFRSLRAVWDIPTQPSSMPHYATFPEKLVETCLLAGCPETVCAVCGAPYVRVVESERIGGSGESSNLKLQSGAVCARGGNQAKFGNIGVYRTHDYGFAPSCACGSSDTAHGIVIDPFMGSGRVGVIARRFKRHFIGCDLNPEYVEMGNMNCEGQIEEYKAKKAGKPYIMRLF